MKFFFFLKTAVGPYFIKDDAKFSSKSFFFRFARMVISQLACHVWNANVD